MAGGLNRNITVRLLADTSKFTAGMAKVSAEAEKTSTTMEASGGKTKLLTAGIAAAGIAATALGVAAVRMAADFDASMSTVQANTGASADEMSLLRQAAIDAGADTVYSATDAADAINELGKAGMSTSDILSGGLNGALDLAASDGMEVAEAAELMSSAMAQFNLTGADATRIADALAAGAGKAQGSARDLGYALQQSGMVANSFGISMEETGGYSRKISFADINDGKAYVEDATALAIWGIPGPNGTRIHSEADAEFPDCEDPKQLLTLTKEALKTRSQPVVSYECDVTSLAAAGVNAEGTDIGDTVHIIDTSFPTPLRLEGRILQIEQDLAGDQTATTITLGNITTGITRQDDAWRRQLDQLISNSGAWNDAATGTKPYITDLINRINQIMNTTGGYTYLKPGQGIYVYDKPEDQNPTQCIHIGGGYWRIANSKKANGDWDFRALADGNGIYANTIYTGKLSDAAGHNQWNLDTGELTTRGMTATSITAEGTFACGSKDWYGIELNSIGQLAGYRKGKKVGYIDYSGGMYEVSNPSKVYYGLQLQGGCLRISTPILSVAKTTDTHVTTTHAYNGKHHYISKITSSSDGTITWFQSTTEYINGFCIN